MQSRTCELPAEMGKNTRRFLMALPPGKRRKVVEWLKVLSRRERILGTIPAWKGDSDKRRLARRSFHRFVNAPGKETLERFARSSASAAPEASDAVLSLLRRRRQMLAIWQSCGLPGLIGFQPLTNVLLRSGIAFIGYYSTTIFTADIFMAGELSGNLRMHIMDWDSRKILYGRKYMASYGWTYDDKSFIFRRDTKGTVPGLETTVQHEAQHVLDLRIGMFGSFSLEYVAYLAELSFGPQKEQRILKKTCVRGLLKRVFEKIRKEAAKMLGISVSRIMRMDLEELEVRDVGRALMNAAYNRRLGVGYDDLVGPFADSIIR
jgi:hypothetical protein